MPRFFVMTSRGLEPALQQELEALQVKSIEKAPSGFYFEGNWAACYRANLRLRSATRVLLPILDFPAYKPEDIYHNIRKHDFTKYIAPDATLAVDATVRESSFQDQRFVALKVKDAIVDQFREKAGERPDVDKKNPDLLVFVRVVNNQFSVSIDTSGDPLFKRGYRTGAGDAPLKEHVAAGLLLLSEWDRKTPIVDPMCGSGTFIIEAALMALNIAPGTLRKRFGFQRLLSFKKDEWEAELESALADEVAELDFQLFGSDYDRQVIAIARKNAQNAGVDGVVSFERQAFETMTPPFETGWLVTNPPYGERLGDKGELLETYKNLAFLMKTKFKGWTCWLLSGAPELSAALKLKAERRIPVYNGPIDCRFLKYKMF